MLGAAIAGGILGGESGNYYKIPALIEIATGKFYELDEQVMTYLLFANYHDLYLEYRNLKDRSNPEDVFKIIDKFEAR